MRNLYCFLVALLLAASTGSIAQSLDNLNRINALSGPVPAYLQLQTIGFDLLHFMPVVALIYLPALALGLVVTAQLSKRYGLNPFWLSLPFVMLLLQLELMVINALVPMPTLIALNRSLGGTLYLLLAGALGAACFYWLSRRKEA